MRPEDAKLKTGLTYFLSTFFSPADNTAGIMTRKDGYSRHKMSTYLLPILIFDNDYPIQSSTGTLTIRVCACDQQGNMQSCSAQALVLAAGLSTGALVAILLCVIILLGKAAAPGYPTPTALSSLPSEPALRRTLLYSRRLNILIFSLIVFSSRKEKECLWG